MKKLKLSFVTYDSCDRAVYKGSDGNIYVDVDPRKHRKAEIYRKHNNDYDGEPDAPVSGETEIEFTPERKTW